MKKKNPLQISLEIAVDERGGWWGGRPIHCRVSYDRSLTRKADNTYSLGFRLCRTTRGEK